MTSRIHAAHTICTGCSEKIFLDELVSGRCPLCGYSLEEDEMALAGLDSTTEYSDLAWLVFNYFLFRKFYKLGADPIGIMKLISRFDETASLDEQELEEINYNFEVPITPIGRVLPKRCSHCSRIFFRGGKQIISGNLKDRGFSRRFVCSGCDSR